MIKSPIVLGQRFGRLVIVEIIPGQKRAGSPSVERRARCQCDCGQTTTSQVRHLRSGESGSCGCLAREMRAAEQTKHGYHQTPTYKSWCSMYNRTSNPRMPEYRYHGARGIKLCERWRKFENFLADMGERPPGKTLDRINNDGHYEPGNCRWATPSEQNLNRRPRHLWPSQIARAALRAACGEGVGRG